MTAEGVPARRACPRCESTLPRAAPSCATCGWIDLNPLGAASQQPGFGADVEAGSSRSYSLASLMLLVTVSCILLAITVAAPGLGIMLAVLSVPPWVRTAMVIKRRRQLGHKTDTGSQAVLFVTSLFVTFAMVAALLASCVLTFCGVCITLASSLNKEDEIAIIAVSSVATIAVGAVVAYGFYLLIRRRYRSDIDPLKKGNQNKP